MLNIKWISENPDKFNEAMKKRNINLNFDYIEKLNINKKEQITKLQNLQSKRNTLSKEIGILKSKNEDAQVYNIMDGKVIYAQEMSGLKKVVVIEHANAMHTIYSMLDKIAPTLRPGFIVKQGDVIGRVNDRLNLEIVQAGKHINPIEVIATK